MTPLTSLYKKITSWMERLVISEGTSSALSQCHPSSTTGEGPHHAIIFKVWSYQAAIKRPQDAQVGERLRNSEEKTNNFEGSAASGQNLLQISSAAINSFP
ncbi:hypothetical protein J6590_066387 [Homalodisca vitripennis]|nr:hypothetical protein J6590_066387 [Homalodisca vitripennis]